MPRLLIYIILLSSTILSSQNESLDSLKNIWQHNSDMELKEQIQLLINIADRSKRTQADTCVKYALLAKKLIDPTDWYEEKTKVYKLLAQAHNLIGDNKTGLEYCQIMVDFAQKTEDPNLIVDSYMGLRMFYRWADKFEKSLEVLEKAMDYLPEINEKMKFQVYSSMATDFRYSDNVEEAIHYFQLSYDLSEELNDSVFLARSSFNLGSTFADFGQMEKAKPYLMMSMTLGDKYGFSIIRTYSRITLSEYYLEKEDYDQAFVLADSAYRLGEEFNLPHSIAGAAFPLGKCYVNNGDLNQAIHYFEIGSQITKELNDLNNFVYFQKALSEAYESKQNYKKSLEYAKTVIEWKDSIYVIEQENELLEFEKKYQAKEKQNQLEVQELKIQQQRSLNWTIGIVALLLLVSSILAWRNIQQNKQTNYKLQQLDRAKTRFFANISHELRTPLTLIIGPIENVLEKIKSKSAKDDMQLALSNSKKLQKLVNEILDLTKLESGKMELKETEINLEQLLRRIFSSYHSLAHLKGFILNFSYHLPKNLTIKLDVEKFENILNNLLSNAFKYSQFGGSITLRASEENGQLKLEIEDTGTGISFDELEKVFERFYQINDESDTQAGGSGIGLAYAKEIAQLFGGKLYAESELGKGSNFILTFPLKKTKTKILAESIEDKTPLPSWESIPTNISASNFFGDSKPRILIVEDNHDMSQFLNQTLSPLYQCEIAADGKQALSLLSKQKFDLITSDVMMPNMDGFTFLEKVHEMEQFRYTPVIMLTARALEEDRLKGLQLGVDDYLTKPFSTKELLARINNLLKNKALRDELELEDEANKPIQESLSYDEKLLQRAETLVFENLNNTDFKVTDLAKAMNYSPKQLGRILRKQTGLTSVEFIREIRLQKAYRLLESRQFATIAEVRYEVGMEDASHFIQKFHERFGKKPSQV